MKELAANLIFIVDAFRITKHGGAKITLSLSEDQAMKAAALAGSKDAVFEADIFLRENETYGSKIA